MSAVEILQGQDPFFLQAQQIRGYLNPALTGMNGVFTLKVLNKNQFYNQSDFNTQAVSAEWSVPCYRIDFGGYYLHDVEGDGRLRTQQLGGTFVYSVSPSKSKKYRQNIRMGIGSAYTRKSIDWSKLNFSDQFDKKYGLQPITAFVSPDHNAINIVELNAGVVYTALYKKSIAFTIGGSFTNGQQILGDSGHNSLLGLGQPNRFDKISFYVNSDLTLFRFNQGPIVLQPSLIIQRQNQLQNTQIGARIKSDYRVNVGTFLSIADFEEISNDLRVLTFEVGVGLLRNTKNEINVTLQYGFNVGALSNNFGDNYQITATYLMNQNSCGPITISRTDCYKFIDGEILYEDAFFIPIEGIDK